MKTVKLKFSYQGPITQLPTSQMIFGALCHGIKSIHGNDVLESFLTLIEKDSKIFAVSSMQIINTVPFPLNVEPKRLEDAELDQAILTKVKQLKKVRLISLKLFEAYKQNPDAFNEEFISRWLDGTYVFNDKHMLLHDQEEEAFFRSIQVKKHVATRNKWSLDDDEKALFYTSRLIYSSNTEFECYLYTNDQVLSWIIEALEQLIYINFGGKKSIGLNLFKYINNYPVVRYETTTKMLLSKALVVSEGLDLDKASYKISIIESVFDHLITDVRYRKPMIVFDEGSVFTTQNHVIGAVVKDSQVLDYQNALGLLL